MNTSTDAALGILSRVLGLLSTGLMFHYWGYAFDKEKDIDSVKWYLNETFAEQE